MVDSPLQQVEEQAAATRALYEQTVARRDDLARQLAEADTAAEALGKALEGFEGASAAWEKVLAGERAYSEEEAQKAKAEAAVEAAAKIASGQGGGSGQSGGTRVSSDTRQRIYAAVLETDGATSTMLQRATKLSRATVNTALKQLRDEQQVRLAGKGERNAPLWKAMGAPNGSH